MTKPLTEQERAEEPKVMPAVPLAQYMRALATIDHMEAQRNEAVALLRSRQWVIDGELNAAFCPWCEAEEPRHEPNCEAAAHIAKHPEQP
ncbi:hypothetical protein LCGC14_2326220 [marine sediment metagenome]|uniref:Uncharacterized protein n=1 Tax=marine sediment metagenome TaxID=412755 RepID=A0A0F9FBA8_9ZZZZ